MEPRFNMFDNEIGAKFSKRFANASLVIAQSPLHDELIGRRIAARPRIIRSGPGPRMSGRDQPWAISAQATRVLERLCRPGAGCRIWGAGGRGPESRCWILRSRVYPRG